MRTLAARGSATGAIEHEEPGEGRARGLRATLGGRAGRPRGAVLRRGRGLLGYAATVAGSAAARLLSFVVSVLVARALGPADFGDFAVFLALLFVFATAGDFVNVTYVRHATTSGLGPPLAHLRGALVAKLALSGVLALAAYPLAYGLARGVFGRPELVLPVLMAILTGTAMGLVSFRAATFLARSRYAAYAAVNSSFYAAIVLVIVPLYALGALGAVGLLYALFLGTAAALALVAVGSLLPTAWPLSFEAEVLGRIVSFAKWLAVANLVQLLYHRLDILLLARFVPEEEVGYYGAALRIGVVGALLIGAMSNFLLPRVARTTESRAQLVRFLREGMLIAAGIVVASAVVWVAAPAIVTALFGAEFAPAVAAARIVLVGTALFAVSAPLAQLFLANRVPRQLVGLGLTRLAVVLVLSLLLAPRLGAEGAAWAYAASELAALLYVAGMLGRQHRRAPVAAPARAR